MTAIVHVGYDSTNYYVLGQGPKRLLVDIGWSNTMPKFLAELKRKGVPLEQIGYLLATHYHPDHAGLAQELKAKGVRLVVIDLQEPFVPILKTWMKPINKYQDITLDDNVALTCAGSRAFLATLGISGQIIHTPGHSDDSVTLVLDEGIAFIGDLTHPLFVDESTAAVVLNSWDKIRALNVHTIHAGHGPSRPMPPPSRADGTLIE
jgi:glyoxylase-like metal-dependent hydrolase (beta-lactamase superfamily II)